MMSKAVDIADAGTSALERISMEAMMARVEVNIKLSPNQTSRDGSLPKLVVESYGVENMAASVPYTMPATTDLSHKNKRAYKLIEDRHEVSANSSRENEMISLVYYTYENIQGVHTKSNYPDGVEEEDRNGSVKQRWKPTIADETEINGVKLSELATRIVINGEYTTHQGFVYKAKFSIYLGENPVDNFSVKRNHCYTNNVTIHGLDYVRNEDNGEYTFDGRVNVKDEGNPWYISVVNERKVDSHASVLPMDIYLVFREDETIEHPDWSQVDVEIRDDANGQLCDWIGFEMIDYPTGMIGNGNPNEVVAGRGAKDYFYHNLVTAPLEDNGANKFGIRKQGWYRIEKNAGNGTSYYVNTKDNAVYTADDIVGAYSRMRIYFYIDENVPTAAQAANTAFEVPSRHASVHLTYTNSNGMERERTIEIDQEALILVNKKHDSDGRNDPNCQFYIETYEEYLEHSDPLEYHVSPEVFTGLKWGQKEYYFRAESRYYALGVRNITANWYDKDNYHNGREFTQNLFGTAITQTGYTIAGNNIAGDIKDVKLYNLGYSSPEAVQDAISAIAYAYGKNKRQSSLNAGESEGAVYTGGPGLWELPGIRDLETAMEQHYTKFSDFQGHFYWSSAPGRSENNYLLWTDRVYLEDNGRARACKIVYDPSNANANADGYTHAESSGGNNYTNDAGNGGAAPRDINTIRIRAAYKTNQQNALW